MIEFHGCDKKVRVDEEGDAARLVVRLDVQDFVLVDVRKAKIIVGVVSPESKERKKFLFFRS